MGKNNEIEMAAPTPPPGRRLMGTSTRFRLIAQNEQEEQTYDYVTIRALPKPVGVIGSVAHMVKGALGGGILAGHVALKKGGVAVAIPLNIAFGFYMSFCLHLLVESAQILYQRTQTPVLSYPDVGEAALACFPKPRIARFAKLFRHIIGALICIDLFGACACYQLVIAKSIKQLVENVQKTTLPGLSAGYPHLRVYLAAILIPIILICLIRHLKWLAPFSIGANIIILCAMVFAIYYAFVNNPKFLNMKPYTTMAQTMEFSGMVVFSMSCAGVVLPIENNMKEPNKFPLALVIGMSIIVVIMILFSLFGYAAYLEESESPITVNFPMGLTAKMLKGLIAFMIYVTHAINFWPPFHICYHYLRQLHTTREVMWELIYRALFVCLVSIIAISFPAIDALMGFLGSFCLSNMAFIWPNFINLLVIWYRPGLGKYKWRLWRNLFLICVGIFFWACGTFINLGELISVFLSALRNVQS